MHTSLKQSRSILLLTVALCVASLLSSCFREGAIVTPPSVDVTPTPPQWFKTGMYTLDFGGEIDHPMPSLSTNARVVIAWESGFDSSHPTFVFYGAGTVVPRGGGGGNDHLLYKIHLSDSLPYSIILNSVNPTKNTDTMRLAVGHVFLCDDANIKDGLTIDTVSLGRLKLISNANAMTVVFRIGTPMLPNSNGQMFINTADSRPGYTLFSSICDYHGHSFQFAPIRRDKYFDSDEVKISADNSVLRDAYDYVLWLFKP